MGTLSGRKALVTGSSSGIGEAIARRLAAEGAAVAVHGRNRERAERTAAAVRALGVPVMVALGDLADPEATARVVAEVQAGFGGIDILVNNAGGEPEGAGNTPWFDVTDEGWVTAYQINVLSAVRMVRAFLPAMKAQGWGRIVNIGSAVVDNPMTTIPDYQAAKAAMDNMSASLAKAAAHAGITANSISTGFIATPSAEGWLREVGKRKGWGEDWDEIQRRAARELVPTLVDRVGRPDDIANAVAFLASPASDFITGASLRVDGGGSLV